MLNIDDLKFVRTYGFTYPYGHIPRELFEQEKEMDKDAIDRIYKFGDLFAKSPLTLLYVMIDDANAIKGVLWANIDIIEAIIFIKFLSVDPEYQSVDGRLLNKVKDFLFGLKTGPALKKEIHFLTTRPVAFEEVGCKRSEKILMEITNANMESEITEKN